MGRTGVVAHDPSAPAGSRIEAEFLQALDEPVDGALPGAWVDAWRVAVLEQRAVTKRIVADHGPRRSTSCAAAPLPFLQHRGARPRAGGLP